MTHSNHMERSGAARDTGAAGGPATPRRHWSGADAPLSSPPRRGARGSGRPHVGRWGSGPGHDARAIAAARYARPRPAGLKNGTRGRRRRPLPLRRGQRLSWPRQATRGGRDRARRCRLLSLRRRPVARSAREWLHAPRVAHPRGVMCTLTAECLGCVARVLQILRSLQINGAESGSVMRNDTPLWNMEV